MRRMVEHYFKTREDTTLSKLSKPKTGVWTHLSSPSETELNELIRLYDLDTDIVEDIKDVFEVPRFEKDGAIAYFFTRYPYDVQDVDIDTAPILFILGETFLITVTEEEVPFLNPFIEGKRDFSTVHKTQLFLELMSEIVVKFERKLTRTRRLVYKDMGRIRSIRGRDIQRLVFLEQELNETISALIPTNAWLHQLTKGDYIQMFGEDRDMLDDLLISNNQLVDSAQSILKTIQNIRGASEAMLTQNLNSTIRTLTVFTIVLTIPTLVSSFFGMNVVLPFQKSEHGFLIVIAIIAVCVGTTVYFFKRNRWI